MKPTALNLLILAALLSIVTSCHGAPSLIGPTGLYFTPTAALLSKLQIDGSVSMSRWERGGQEESLSYLRLNIGLSNHPNKGKELSFARIETRDGQNDVTLLGFKMRMGGVIQNGRFALGILLPVEGDAPTTIYGVGTTGLSKSLAIHYGTGVNFGGAPGDESFMGSVDERGDPEELFFFFAAEKDWRKWKFNFEFDGDRESWGLTYFVSNELSLDAFRIGEGSRERLGSWRPRLGFGATFRF